MRSLQQILDQVNSYSPRYVTVTGGEPLAQPNCIPLLSQLCDLGLEVSLETSGALDVSEVDSRVSIVLDLKTPGSGEMHRNLYSNLEHLKPKDQIKFVICGRQDYQWAKMQLSQLKLDLLVGDVLFSPSHQAIEPADLANWIVEDNLPVRFQLQLHKILWADQPGY